MIVFASSSPSLPEPFELVTPLREWIDARII